MSFEQDKAQRNISFLSYLKQGLPDKNKYKMFTTELLTFLAQNIKTI